MAAIIWIGLTIIVTLSVIVVILLLVTKNTHTRPFFDKNGRTIEDSVAEQLYLPLGGLKQWVLLRGRTIHNPILIFLHGGPGISLHALFRYFHHELENHFIVVGWDQRGAGKSYSVSIPQDSMKTDVFIEDLHELIRYLKKRFNQDKVYILGESWGALLGTRYAHKYPEDVAAYIGTGQVSNMAEAQRLGLAFALAQAKIHNNQKALSQLQAIKQPPGSLLNDRLVQHAWVVKFGGCLYKKTRYPLAWFFKMLCMDEYAWPDLLKIGPCVKLSMTCLWPEIFYTNFFDQVPELKVPIYFLLGKYDYNTSSNLAAQYFDYVKAPKKELVWFQYSGHNPMFEEPMRFKDTLLSIRYNNIH